MTSVGDLILMDSPLSNIVARRVRGVLAEAEKTQQDLAQVLGISASAMSKRLRGVMPFALDELAPVAIELDVSLDYLLGLTEARKPGSEIRLPSGSRQLPFDLGAYRARRHPGLLLDAGDAGPSAPAAVLVFRSAKRAS